MKQLILIASLLWSSFAFGQTKTVTYSDDANKRIVQPLLKVRSGGSIVIESGGNITLNSGGTLAIGSGTISGNNGRLVPTGSASTDILVGGTTPGFVTATGIGAPVRADGPLFVNNPIQTTAGIESYGYVKMIAAASVPSSPTGNVGYFFQTGAGGANLMGWGSSYDIALRNSSGVISSGLTHGTLDWVFTSKIFVAGQVETPNGIKWPGSGSNGIELRAPYQLSGGLKTVWMPAQNGTLAIAGTPLIAATTSAVNSTGTTTVTGTGVGTEFGTPGSVILLQGQPYKAVSSPNADTLVVAVAPPALTSEAPLKLANNHMFEVKNYNGTVVFSVEPDGITNTSGQINCIGGANILGFLSQQSGPVVLGNSGSTDYTTILSGSNVVGLNLSNSLTGSNTSSSISVNSGWNTTGSPALIYGNVSLTSANAASDLIRLQVDSVTKFNVRKDGQVTASAFIGDGSGLTGISSLPVVDTTAIAKGSVDATKQVRLEVDGLTTATTRVLTTPDFDGTIATLAGTETLTNKTFSGNGASITALNMGNASTGTLLAARGGTGISSLATGMATWFGTSTSANLAATVTNETGAASGSPLLVFNESPTLNGINVTGSSSATISSSSGITISTSGSGAVNITSSSSTGSINNMAVGQTTPLAGKFTQFDKTGKGGSTYTQAASESDYLATGALYTGGTGTTTFPLFFHQPTGTTAATTWSNGANNGTIFGANQASGFTGNFVDCRVAGVNLSGFKIDYRGTMTFGTTGVTIGSTVGGVISMGGAPDVSGNIHSTGYLNIEKNGGGSNGSTFGGNTLASSIRILALTSGAGNKGIVSRGFASQTANLFEAQDSTPTAVFSVSPTGAITADAQAVKVGGTLKVDTTTVGNVGGGEDVLTTYTIPAATFAANGDHIEFDTWGSFAANANTKALKLYFGSTVIVDTTALILNGVSWRVHGKIVRTGATTQTVTSELTIGGMLLSAVNGTISSTTAPTETLSGTVVFKCAGTDSGVTPADNSIVQNGMVLHWFPNK